jgi:hypothetical protein
MTSYADGKYRVINRKWFGLKRKWGGDAATAAIEGGNTSSAGATGANLTMQYWRPGRPLTAIRAGVLVMATLGTPANATKAALVAKRKLRFWHTGSTATLQYTFARPELVVAKTNRTPAKSVVEVSCKEYIPADGRVGMYFEFPTTAKGSLDAGTGTKFAKGSLAAFIDYVPTFTGGGEWDR